MMPDKADSQGSIRNCPWGYKCDKTWNSLTETDDADVRICNACEKTVHLCVANNELADAVMQNHCVAVPKKLLYIDSFEDNLEVGIGPDPQNKY